MQRRSAGLLSGSGPDAFTAMAISLPIHENAFAILSQRANMVDFLTSNILPIGVVYIIVTFKNRTQK
jgi:hypothetical protein